MAVKKGGVSVKVEVGFKLPFHIEKKEGWYIACCPVLDVFSQGKTEKKARKNLIETLKAFLTSCIERGTLGAVLKECGFVSATSPPRIETFLKKEDYIDIPLHLLAQSSKGAHCHA